MRPRYLVGSKIFALLFLFSTILIGGSLLRHVPLQAATTSVVQSTVNLSICGGPPYIIEDGEDCELNGHLSGRTCQSLGYNGGPLSCDFSCSYDTSLCIAPVINPLHVSMPEVPKLPAAGYLVPVAPLASITATKKLRTATTLVLYMPMNGGETTLMLPDQTTLSAPTNTRFDATTFSTAVIALGPVPPDFSSNTTLGTIFWGPTSSLLVADSPITISIYVGSEYNGRVSEVLHSTDSLNWQTSGVSPSICTILLGRCTFQTTLTGYLTVRLLPLSVTPTSTPLPTVTASTDAIKSLPIYLPNVLITTLPLELYIYDLDRDGKVSTEEFQYAARLWVTSHNDFLVSFATRLSNSNVQFHCDLNTDKICNLIDFSILMYYIER